MSTCRRNFGSQKRFSACGLLVCCRDSSKLVTDRGCGEVHAVDATLFPVTRLLDGVEVARC